MEENVKVWEYAIGAQAEVINSLDRRIHRIDMVIDQVRRRGGKGEAKPHGDREVLLVQRQQEADLIALQPADLS